MFGLVNTILRDFLGKYGSAFLDFLLTNSFVICSIVIAYGVIHIMAQRNLEKLRKTAKNHATANISCENNASSVVTETDLEFWENLRGESRFPFITLPSSILLYRVTGTNIQKLTARLTVYEKRRIKPVNPPVSRKKGK